ncbi:MAG TPA: hypothetical protein VNM67_02275 [Thermoanaerobaculia bacterium]|nr:hypothetical protein [Thermoanaerobaculia bacterium]
MEPMTPGPPRKSGTSPWVYIGCGCAGLVILGLAAFSAFTYFAYRKGKEMEKTWSDPKAREEKAREVLAYDKLPEGYYPLGAVSIPFVMDMAMIGDNPPPAGSKPDDHEGFKDRGFMYFKVRRMGKGDREVRDFMAGKGKKPDWINSDSDFDKQEVLGRGELDANGQKVLFSAMRGEVSQNGEKRDGITTMMLIDCPKGKDERIRFGLWFGPDPAPGEPGGKLDLAGTNADPAAIQAFASHFRFCQ